MTKRSQKPVDVYLSRWAEGTPTRKTMAQALDRIAQVLGGEDASAYPWHEIDYAIARSVPSRLRGEGLETNTINKMLSALRGVLETCWRTGMISDEEYRRIEVKNERGKALPAGRALEAEEVDAAHAILSKKTGEQEAALVAVLFACGLRRHEAKKLRREDYVEGDKQVRARGKGNKARLIPVPPRWQPIIEAWFGKLEPRALAFPMELHQISYIVECFCDENKLKRFTPHDLRRTFITRVCDASDISIAQKLAGHENLNTTAIYDRRGEAVKRKAVEDL